MKRNLTLIMGLLMASLATAQTAPPCEGDSYTSQIISQETIAENCTRFTLKVSYDHKPGFELAKYTIDIPCGEVKDLTNSGGWSMAVGKDQASGLEGIIVSGIKGFGQSETGSFTVSFTWCCDGTCDKKVTEVAYTCGACVDHETLPDTGNPPDGGGGDNPPGGGGGDNPPDGGGDNPPDGGGDNPPGGGGGDNPPDGGDPTDCSILLAHLQKENEKCPGSHDGSLKVMIDEGKTPIKYAWSNGATTPTVDGLSAGSYAVTITDAAGNTLTLNEAISAPAPIVITETLTNPACNGQFNGSIALSVSGGTGGYSFAWSNGATTKAISDLASGFYTVTVTDEGGCSAVKTLVLTNGAVLSAEVKLTQPTCNQKNGAIDITPMGGVPPYTYSWSTQAKTEDVSGLGAGSYVVTIRDAAGCFTNKLYTLTEVGSMLLQYAVTPASCKGDNSGEINLTIIGGMKPYKIEWQDGQITEDRVGLIPGIYGVTVTDAIGCKTSAAIGVNKKDLQVNSVVTQPACADDLGSIKLTPTDGNGPYSYTWAHGATGSTLEGLTAGNYIATITDAAGCNTVRSLFVIAPAAITATGVIHNTECGAANAYAIDLSVTGGNAPYTYLWSNGATTKNLTGLSPGNFTVDIKDALGCVVRKEFLVNPLQSWTCLIAPPSAPVVCASSGNLLATAVTDATSYAWSVTSTDNNWSITSGASNRSVVYTAGNEGSSATFTLTIIKDGCTQTCSYEIEGSCNVRDNTGGGDPSSDDPCARPAVAVAPEMLPEKANREELVDPVSVNLVNVYPNPFNNNIRFEWSSPQSDKVRLEIFDLTGRSQLVIFEGEVASGKQYTVDTDLGKLTDGVHYLRYAGSKQVDYLKILKVK